MRREAKLTERVLFGVLLGVSLLLLSLAMLRSDMAAPAAATHTFRDGFIVADRVERRTETATPADAADGAKMLRREAGEDTASKAPAAAIHVSGADAHTTTIKMEGGDEITIKRAASSKNKITTISTHEDGKITIENRDTAAAPAAATDDDAVAAGSAASSTPAPPLKQAGGVGGAASVSTAALVAATEAPPAPLKKRSVDFVGEYDATENRRDATAADADSEEPTAAGDSTHEIVVGKKKVTVVNVGRSETTVSLSDVAEATAAAKLQTSSR